MLENLFMEKSSPFYDEIMRIKTGEEAISFFAKNGNNAPLKFLYCVKDNSDRDFRPYDLVVIKEKDVR